MTRKKQTFRQKFNELSKPLENRVLAGVVGVIAIAAIVGLGVAMLRFVDPSQAPLADASFTTYENGQVSVDVEFYDGASEIANVITLPSETVTIRVNYGNTGELQATAAQITSTLPSGFTYVPGTLRNVYDLTNVATLDDSLFSGQTLTVSPSAGMYDNTTTDASGVLDIGKADYLRVQKCSVTSSDDELFVATTNDETQASNSAVGNTCSSFVTGSFLSGISIPLVNYKYLKSIECQPGSGINETFAQYSSNTAASSSTDSTGHICATALTGSSFVSVADIDLTSGRYARVLRCDHTTNDDEFLLAPALYDTDIGTSDATGENCSTAYPGSTFLSGENIDLLNTTNGAGYIEFQATTPGADGCYDISASLDANEFAQISETATCGVRVQSGSVLTNGQIQFNKTYYDGLNNLNTVTLPIGGFVKVRLNYNNTSSDIAYGMAVTDSFDTTYFEYQNGTAQHCYFTANCVPLDDASFSSGTIALGPQVGSFGNSTTDSTTPIEPGRERYLHIVQCSDGSNFDTFVAEANTDPLTVTGSCSSYGLTGYTKTATRTVDVAGNRYLNMVTCENGGFYDTFVAEASNTAGESASLCTSFGMTGYTNVTSFGVDLQGATELNLKKCDKTGVKDTYISEASNTAGASASGCFDSGTTGYSDDGGFGISVGNTSNGYGYIEYQLRVTETVSLGSYGATAGLAQAGVDVAGTITEPATCPSGSTGPDSSGNCDVAAQLPDIYWRCEDYASEAGYDYVQVQTAQNTFIVDDHDIDQTQSWLCNANKEVNLVATTDINTQIAWVCSDYALPTGYNYVYVYNGTSLVTQANSVDVNDAAAGCSGSWSLAANGTLAQEIAWLCSGEPSGFTKVKGITDTGAIDGTVPDIDTNCGDVEMAIVDSRAEVSASTFAASCPVGYLLVNDDCELSGESINSLSADSTSTIDVQLYCDSIIPASGVRNISLSDAELRTDQDFTCNFNAEICPVVFEDLNLDGTKGDNENIFDVVTVELRRNSDNVLVQQLTTDINASGLQCFTNLASGEIYDVVIPTPPTTFSTTGADTVTVESSVLTLQQIVPFGYSSGGILIDATPEIFFPTLTVSATDEIANTSLPFVEVRDLRTATLPWTVTGVVQDFVGQNNGAVLPISSRYSTTPQTVTVTQGDGQLITVGGNKTVSSNVDPADIFNTGANDGSGQYEVDVNIDYNVPAYSTVDTYQTTMTFTVI